MSTSESDIVQRISALNQPEPTNEPARPPEPNQADAGSDHESASPVGEQAPEPSPDAGAPSGSPEEGSNTGEVEEIEVGDLNDLASHLGVDPAELYNIAVPFTVEGQKQEFTLGEIKDQVTKFRETEALRAESQAQYDTYRQASEHIGELIQAHAIQAEAVQKSLENQLLADFSGVNWQQLQATNPNEYIRQAQNLQARQAQIAQIRQESIQFIEQQKEQLNAHQNHLREQRLLREQQALLKAIPEWRDQSVADAERQSIAQYMLTRGYNEGEINAVDDHRAILLVRDAMRYRQMQANADVAVKKVLKLAKKIVTPGSRQTASEQKTDAERGLRSALRKSGSTQDAAALISLRMGRKK